MMVNGKMDSKKEKEFFILKMEIDMKEILRMIIWKEEEFIIIVMEIYMKANLKMMPLMDVEFFIVMMGLEKWEIIQKENL